MNCLIKREEPPCRPLAGRGVLLYVCVILIGMSTFVSAHLAGEYSEFVFEHPGEITRALKSAAGGDVRDAHGGVGEHRFGHAQAENVEIFAETAAEQTFEQTTEMALVIGKIGGRRAGGNLVLILIVQILQDFPAKPAFIRFRLGHILQLAGQQRGKQKQKMALGAVMPVRRLILDIADQSGKVFLQRRMLRVLPGHRTRDGQTAVFERRLHNRIVEEG